MFHSNSGISVNIEPLSSVNGSTKHSDCINMVWRQVLTWQWWWSVLSKPMYVQRKEKENKLISGYMPIRPGVPHTLLLGFHSPCSNCAWLCWMYQLSNMQHVVVCRWWSSTSDCLSAGSGPYLAHCGCGVFLVASLVQILHLSLRQLHHGVVMVRWW